MPGFAAAEQGVDKTGTEQRSNRAAKDNKVGGMPPTGEIVPIRPRGPPFATIYSELGWRRTSGLNKDDTEHEGVLSGWENLDSASSLNNSTFRTLPQCPL